MDERHSRPHTSDPTPPASPAGDDSAPDREPELRDRPAIRDALFALLFMFPAAALVAVVYRFPIPMGGTARGPAGAWDAILATIFYGLAGGFLVVPLLAAGAGALLRRRTAEHPALVALPSVGAALFYALVLALLA